MLDFSPLVFANGFTSVPIKVGDQQVFERCLGNTERQTARANEKFYRVHLIDLYPPTCKNAATLRRTRFMSDNSHSHITSDRHREAASFLRLTRSRNRFASNFERQKITLDFGMRARGHPRWRCQKQPWTKMTLRAPMKTMSGAPGMSRRWSLYL
jgi:hypothetical protein